ncbi:gamma-glutamylcyclotransferase family protein [Devosia faecipullorum]|uniref:gamma-glutamylcyclotransferase family protein n=1 Tax=Devosia faecipullorum TaxID=2755039 RepID=UPI00187BB1E2|nr:gamma-glutamylcyclotransferase family protein [Devosia faecipullorum]MBE7732824.1 gamma-glutamylcyclotransferase [Devosia faecipullorum]
MIPQPLFAYGTLQDADILAAVLGKIVREADQVPAHLADHAIVYHPGRVYPALLPRPDANAPGCLIAGLGPSDLAALDAFEGDEYRRESRPVMTAAGLCQAFVYWPTASIPEEAPLWTLSFWRAHHKPEILAAELALARAAHAAGPSPSD